MRLNLEQLEQRQLLVADWHNAFLPYDVNGSNTVQASDVLLVVNDLHTSGFRNLGVRPAGSNAPLCDVNGDNRMTAQDALLSVAGLTFYTSHPLTLDVNLDVSSDPNGNEVVLQSAVTYQGLTLPYTRIKVEAVDSNSSLELQELIADRDGKFQVHLTLTDPINQLKFTAQDPRARTKSTERMLRYGDVIAEWNAEMLEAVRETTAPSSEVPGLLIKPPPPLVAKQLAMMHVAMFDAINAINPTYESYAFQSNAQSGASEIAAAATAAHRVASALYSLPFHIEKWDLTLTESLARVPDGPAKLLGIEIGRQAADAILAQRTSDGASESGAYVSQNFPGKWRPTAPGFAPPTLPQWPNVRPFVIEWGGEFRPEAPPDLSSVEYATAVDQAMRLGSNESTERTADQTAIALFWADGGGTVTPPGHWNSIAMDIALTQQNSLVDRARTMALLNLALADAGIGSWDAKYFFDVWRPIDAIRHADSDGNVATDVNPNWTPLLSTPSFPTYTSGHSTFSAAAAEVLGSIFGEQFAFTTQADRGSTGVWPPSDDISGLAVRSFPSFEAAAFEAGMSRIYGGIHFSFDNSAGLSSGKAIGEAIMNAALRPISVP